MDELMVADTQDMSPVTGLTSRRAQLRKKLDTIEASLRQNSAELDRLAAANVHIRYTEYDARSNTADLRSYQSRISQLGYVFVLRQVLQSYALTGARWRTCLFLKSCANAVVGRPVVFCVVSHHHVVLCDLSVATRTI